MLAEALRSRCRSDYRVQEAPSLWVKAFGDCCLNVRFPPIADISPTWNHATLGGRISSFEYITALVSVVVGLAIADMATSLHRLLRNRRRVRWDWVAPLAAVVILTDIF